MTVRNDPTASFNLLARYLEKKGYTTSLTTEKPTIAIFKSPAGKEWKTRISSIRYPFTPDEVVRTSTQKNLAYQLAETVGFPTPQTILVNKGMQDAELELFLARLKRLIVKPVNASLSHGLTLNIDSLSSLKNAVDKARAFSRDVLVQEQVIGEEVRFTVIDGKVESALLRRTARVEGDGVCTIAELIEEENRLRESLVFKYISYPQLDESRVEKSILNSSQIPAKGELVELNHSTMIKGGCSVYEILPQVDESYVRQVESLASHLETKFVVVDVFCRDYTKEAELGNYWFIEFNTSPVLKLYYSCRDGNHFDVLPRLTAAVDRTIHQ